MSADVQGLLELRTRLAKILNDMPNVLAKALYEEAKIEMREAKKRTPRDTWALRKSGKTHKPVISGNNVSVSLTFGNDQVDYAVFVHEDFEAHHPFGQAKFLESTINESRPYIAQRVAKRIEFYQGGVRVTGPTVEETE